MSIYDTIYQSKFIVNFKHGFVNFKLGLENKTITYHKNITHLPDINLEFIHYLTIDVDDYTEVQAIISLFYTEYLKRYVNADQDCIVDMRYVINNNRVKSPSFIFRKINKAKTPTTVKIKPNVNNVICNKLNAIKDLRIMVSKLGLKEAKDLVDLLSVKESINIPYKDINEFNMTIEDFCTKYGCNSELY